MKNFRLFTILIFVASCGGGGGGGSAPPVPFAITLASSSSISIDEDTTYTGNVVATANEPVTLQYELTSTTTNGVLTFSETGAISYSPNENFNGQDEFSYSVTAVEKSVTRNSTVNITINPVNDLPLISMDSKNDLDKDNLIFDPNPTFSISFSDVDNSINDGLTFSASVNNETVPATFTSTSEGKGDVTLDLSNISKAGLFDAEIIISDGIDTDRDTFTTWFISNKQIITVAMDDDKSDGFDSGSTTNKDYYVYYLVGGGSTFGRTDYLFVGDSLKEDLNDGTVSDTKSFRDALLRSINALNDSDAAEFFTGYFDIVVAEPVNPDGTSLASIETGCYDWDEDVYCIGSGDINDSVFDDLFAEHDLVSVLTMIDGRGVNLGNTNIQEIKPRTEYTLMHELGHAHGEMGDEYLTSDDRDVSYWADLNVNTTTQSNPNLLKWKHHIADIMNVAGKDFKVCYNYADGTIYDEGEDATTCDCLFNLYDVNGNRTGRNPECDVVGLFEGNYYGEFDNYRPKYWTIMEGGILKYGEVNTEGFAVGSIHNQGFVDGDDVSFVSNASGTNTGFEIDIDVAYDTSKLKLQWYVDGVLDSSKENQTTIVFDRPTDNSVKVYTWRVEDLTGTVSAPDDVTDTEDFYEGLFNSDFYWCDRSSGSCQWGYNPSDRTQYHYGYINGPMGGTWGINWARW
ncbi:MAG: hypothetical protein CMD50_00225 [Gammaproteobacteria bacterium]|nr:hypothetical protein [Gammaproteobacteria bacterium]